MMLRKAVMLSALALIAGPAAAQDSGDGNEWPLCPVPSPIPPRPLVTDVLEPGDIHVLADVADLEEEGVSHLEGNVQITRDQQQVTAHTADYYKEQDNADLAGEVNYWDGLVYLHGESAHLEFGDGTGSMQDAQYRIVGTRGHGTASELFMDVGDITRGVKVDYTTCDPETPGMDLESNFWRISASSITLNHETDRGSARNVVLRIKDVPVFYSPYLSFPLSKKRKTGFLTPGFGTSNDRGFEVRTPWYWNIAPHMDATLTPRVLTESGVMGMGEYRYLFSRGAGQLNAEYLPNDDRHNGDDRSLVRFLHEQTFADRGRMFMLYNNVSDKRYFEDFGSDLAATSVRYLDRRADVFYTGNRWRLFARVQDFQTVDSGIPITSRPYSRLPTLRLQYLPLRGVNRLNLTMASDFSYFTREDQDGFADVHGARGDLYAQISYPYTTRGTFLTPKLALRATQYDLEDSGPFKQSPSRVIPLLSVDTGAFFEREFDFGGNEFLQSLEPRLYYLYVPDDEQDDLPVFDTGIFNLSYATMFREDRFNGIDRVGDANQFTAAVTSRLVNRSNGIEFGYVRAGMLYYLADQDVVRTVLTTTGMSSTGLIRDDGFGSLIGEFGLNPREDLSLRGEVHWDPDRNVTEKMELRAQYRPDEGRVVNLAYRVRRAPGGGVRRTPLDIEQTDVSFRWPVGPRWSVVGRWNHAVPEGKTLELFGGIEYESCCWGVRAVARRYLNSLDGDHSTGIFLQVELKGLAGIGRSTVDFLEQRIPGYETDF